MGLFKCIMMLTLFVSNRCGLSHLVDMVNASDEGQRKLFEMDEWKEFAEDMKKQYQTKVDGSLLTKHLLDSWEIIVEVRIIPYLLF